MKTATNTALRAVDEYLQRTGHYGTGEVDCRPTENSLTIISRLPTWYLRNIARNAKEAAENTGKLIRIRIRHLPR